MKYTELIQFDPIESVITLTHANDTNVAANLVKSYVMSANMASQIKNNMLTQLNLDDVVDNKGILLVGNYGTGKSHLMSVISAVALDKSNLAHLRNQDFANDVEIIAGRFEVTRIEIGAVTTPLREIIFQKVQQDFKARGLTFDYPPADIGANNKGTLLEMMRIFASKYPDKGYLIVVDEFLDYLKGKNEQAIILDLGFMRELGELAKESRLRVIFGVQEMLFDNPSFAFVSQTINKIRDRFEQVVIRKEDTAFVVSERILKKTDKQKAIIREHLHKFCSLYSNMSERIEEYVSLFPIHPTFIDVFNKIYITENRHILANISKIISSILDGEVDENSPGILSFDNYWVFIRDNLSYRTDANIKEVAEKSTQLEDIINRSFPKKLYKPLAMKIIYALSVHRLTTGDISLRAGLTSENLRDDLCLHLPGLPDQSSDTLQTLVQAVLKDVMTTVSGQFIDHDTENGQYYLDLKKDIDYDEKITQRAAIIGDDRINSYFYEVAYFCLDWDAKEYVPNFKIYEHTLNWHSRHMFREGYLFLGTPESRPTAQPPRDYYIYFVPPYGNPSYVDDKKRDEIFFLFKENEEFKNILRLYAAACELKGLAEEKNKIAYQNKADAFKKKLTRYLSENKNTCFDVVYQGVKKQPMEIMKGNYKQDNPFKETIDLLASLVLDGFFVEKYPEYPIFKTTITIKNQADAIRRAFDRFAGRKEQLGNNMLDSFGLVSGDNITIQSSKYAGYYAAQLDKLPAGAVINFNDIYNEEYGNFIDKKFNISYALLPIVLLGLVYTGRAVITLKDGRTLSASDLDLVPKINVLDIYEFKHISKPKDIQLAELMRLCEILELPTGIMSDSNSREAGLTALIGKTQVAVNEAVRAKSKLDGDFTLWGEPLIPAHIANEYKTSVKRVSDMLGNFTSRFNTVAKLNNFTYTMDEVETLGTDIANARTVLEYESFRSECDKTVNYMVSIEPIAITLKDRIKTTKDVFRKCRDNISIDDGVYGEASAREANDAMMDVQRTYIDIYFEEHTKRRLTVKDSKRKGDVMNGVAYRVLDQLAKIEDILPVSRFKDIQNELAALQTCYELTPGMMRERHYCTKCQFTLGGNEPVVKGAIERIEDKVDALVEEWTTILHNTVQDPFVIENIKFLSAEQREVIDKFSKTKTLPDKVDIFYVNTIKALLDGFDVVTIDGADLASSLSALGAVPMEKFTGKINEIIVEQSKGKDTAKLRIIVKQSV